MLVTHEVQVYGSCPVDGKTDTYDVTVTTRKVIKVEDILAAIHAINWPIFQEEMTQQLADSLGCRIRSIGYHSGIKTTCEV
jgi:galactitol-specific phosphotransferase system IIB component